jgi:uncharacterized membrane protein
MSALLILIILILAVPVLILFGFINITADSFESFGLPSGVAILILVGMFIGSRINIPLGRHRIVEVEEKKFFGLVRNKQMQAKGLSVNVGGAIIPVGLALYLLPRVPLQETALASLLMITISYTVARVIPEKGVGLPILFPALFATIFALVLAREFAAPVAFIAGVSGVLIGADILKLPKVMRENQGILSIGGAGVFDGIFLVAIVAAFLAGL